MADRKGLRVRRRALDRRDGRESGGMLADLLAEEAIVLAIALLALLALMLVAGRSAY